jgi:hypothetical protein
MFLTSTTKANLLSKLADFIRNAADGRLRDPLIFDAAGLPFDKSPSTSHP